MSLILDALNRSREDTGDVPGLGTRHEFAEHRPERRNLYLGLALLVALALIGWLLWERNEESVGTAAGPVEQVSPAPAPAVEADETARAPTTGELAPRKAASVARKPVVQDRPNVQDQPAAREAPVQASAKSAQAEAEPGDNKSVDSAIGALYEEPAEAAVKTEVAESVQKAPAKPQAAPEKKAVEEQDLDIEQMVRKAENQLENARLAEHPAPFVNELSQRTKDTIPTVYYERHEYSGRPGQSLVVLNGQSLKKGGSPVSGMKVEEILPDSVVLSYRGTQFRLRALNSWVNL